MKKVVLTLFLLGNIVYSNTVFFDGTFSPGDWSLHVFEIGTGGSITMTQQASGGNPSEYCRVYLTVGSDPVYSVLAGFYENIHAVYNPRTQGAITSIDYEEDGIMYQGFGSGQIAGPALIQNGKVYYYIHHATHAPFYCNSRTWARYSAAGLVEEDFITFCEGFRCVNWDDHPDFSGNGAPITFGFYRHGSADPM